MGKEGYWGKGKINREIGGREKERGKRKKGRNR